mmetsp:Transcript_133202/g.332556  ORF Transcript_133202/g.332556 Transcript_133202/m.332556 type:complete len:212 (-) Transcript_133202:1625-2260(-)
MEAVRANGISGPSIPLRLGLPQGRQCHVRDNYDHCILLHGGRICRCSDHQRLWLDCHVDRILGLFHGDDLLRFGAHGLSQVLRAKECVLWRPCFGTHVLLPQLFPQDRSGEAVLEAAEACCAHGLAAVVRDRALLHTHGLLWCCPALWSLHLPACDAKRTRGRNFSSADRDVFRKPLPPGRQESRNKAYCGNDARCSGAHGGSGTWTATTR